MMHAATLTVKSISRGGGAIAPPRLDGPGTQYQLSRLPCKISETKMRRKPSLTTDDVLKIVAACKAAGAQIKREPTVAVVDAGGHLLHLERPDRNGVNTVEMST